MEEEQIDEYMVTKTIGRMIKKSPGSLANDRAARRGLPYIKLGSRVLYSRTDIEKYLEERKIYPEN